MQRLLGTRFSFILAALCLALLAACVDGTKEPRPVDKATATATPAADQRDGTVLPGPAVVTATPSLPDEIGGLELVGYLGSGPVRALSVRGDLAYIGLGRMLATIDLSDLARPQRVGYVALLGDVLDVVVAGGPETPWAGRAYA